MRLSKLNRSKGVLTLLFTGVASATSSLAIEKPAHTVVTTHSFEGDQIEIRDYPPYQVAETVVQSSTLEKASTEGFKRLAAFIFGENTASTKMAMTAPVETESSVKLDMTAPVSTEGGNGTWKIRFVMPSQYTLETLPRPKDSRIQIQTVPARRLAVIVFSGRWTDENFATHTDRLQRFLSEQKMTVSGSPVIARYNMPLTPWFLRTNEVQIPVSQ